MKAVRSLGFQQLKEQQRQAILAFVGGRDVFVALPTGYGKSLIYGCLPRVYDLLREVQSDECRSVIMVVSPLKALMEDQCSSFNTLGLIAASVGDNSVCLESFISGRIQIVLISPESLLRGKQWREILKSSTYQENLVGFVVDEAHLIKTW